MPVIPQSCTITLFCWVLDVSNRSFSVDIEDNLTVDHLKDAITKKKPGSFANVDPDELDLWKIQPQLALIIFLQDIHSD
jgi:hypothetical protein